MLHKFNIPQISRPVLRFFLKTKENENFCENLITVILSFAVLTTRIFRLRFLRQILTPSTDISMVTFFFLAFCILYSYCYRKQKLFDNVNWGKMKATENYLMAGLMAFKEFHHDVLIKLKNSKKFKKLNASEIVFALTKTLSSIKSSKSLSNKKQSTTSESTFTKNNCVPLINLHESVASPGRFRIDLSAGEPLESQLTVIRGKR